MKVAIKVIYKNEMYQAPEHLSEIVLNYILKEHRKQKTHIVSHVEHFEDENNIYVVMKWA